MMNRLLTFAALALLTPLSACGVGLAPAVCTMEFRYGIAVQVQDSVTGAWIASGATLVAREGAYVDSVTGPIGSPEMDDAPLVTAGERAGTYDLTIRREGYRPWSRTGVKVERDECHVHPVTLLARMQPI